RPAVDERGLAEERAGAEAGQGEQAVGRLPLDAHGAAAQEVDAARALALPDHHRLRRIRDHGRALREPGQLLVREVGEHLPLPQKIENLQSATSVPHSSGSCTGPSSRSQISLSTASSQLERWPGSRRRASIPLSASSRRRRSSTASWNAGLAERMPSGLGCSTIGTWTRRWWLRIHVSTRASSPSWRPAER